MIKLFSVKFTVLFQIKLSTDLLKVLEILLLSTVHGYFHCCLLYMAISIVVWFFIRTACSEFLKNWNF
jgi:hypothetical protein